MTLLQSIVLGIIQGLTEFLPISSSGHLVIVPYLFNWNIPPNQAFVFDVLVQVATLVAVFAYFWRDLGEIAREVIHGIRFRKPFDSQPARLGWQILLATIPAGIIGFFLKDTVEQAFASPLTTAIFLFGTAILLVIAELVGKRNRSLTELTWVDALWVGFFQAVSIFPGISRSGATMTGGMTRNLDRPGAARFSFLMSIPVMLAAGILAAFDLVQTPELVKMLPVFIPGFIVAGVTGYLAIRWLLRYLLRHTFYDFAIYCFIIGLITLVTYLIRG